MKLPVDLTLDEVVSALRRCKNETQLYGCFEALTRNDMKFWPDSCYQDCTELLREAMGNPELPLYPYANLQDEFEQTAKLFISRTWIGLESKKGLPITEEEVIHMENEAKKISKEAYLEMVEDIIFNNTEYECRYPMDSFTPWQDVDIADGYKALYEYRKKQPKTWVEEQLESCVPADKDEVTDFIDAFFKEYIKRVKKYEKTREVEDEEHMFIRPCELKSIAKEMGVEVDD